MRKNEKITALYERLSRDDFGKKVFKLAAGKTAKSILVSTAVRLAPFNLPQIQALTNHDDMDLYTLGEKKVALYAVIPDNDNTFVRPDRAPCNAEKWYCPA